MASAIIHMCVAKKISEHFNFDSKEYYLGSIAPDLSKQIGMTKTASHFLNIHQEGVPNIEAFLNKYRDTLDNPFNFGYFVHLYTDRVWFKEFMTKAKFNNCVKLLDNTIIETSEEEIWNLIYNDYTNLNTLLLDEYNLDLSLFYEDFKVPDTNIDEIPVQKLDILLEKMADIIMMAKTDKEYVFDLDTINYFIDYCSDKIIKKIDEYGLKVPK